MTTSSNRIIWWKLKYQPWPLRVKNNPEAIVVLTTTIKGTIIIWFWLKQTNSKILNKEIPRLHFNTRLLNTIRIYNLNKIIDQYSNRTQVKFSSLKNMLLYLVKILKIQVTWQRHWEILKHTCMINLGTHTKMLLNLFKRLKMAHPVLA